MHTMCRKHGSYGESSVGETYDYDAPNKHCVHEEVPWLGEATRASFNVAAVLI